MRNSLRNEQIYKEFLEIRYLLEEIDKKLATRVAEPVSVPRSELFFLPNHLRTTYLTAASKVNAAPPNSLATGKSRRIESYHLNQLVQMRCLRKRNDKMRSIVQASGISLKRRRELLKRAKR
jgi:hypothetical protein